MPLWRCPVCTEALDLVDRGMRCSAGHQFDQAKEGYFNLLLANQKRRPDPGDNRDMLTARRDFLASGFYQPLADEVLAHCATGDSVGALLDLGCGEGYYLNYLLSHLTDWQGAGIDISREALRLAGRRKILRAQLCVASSKRIPLLDGAVDRVLSVFAPFDIAEVSRVLGDKGKLIVVSPGAEHLHELKTEIYEQVQHHKPVSCPAGFLKLAQETVQFPMVFSNRDDLSNLLSMTPFVYKLTAEARAKLLARKSVTVQAEFSVAVYGKEMAVDC